MFPEPLNERENLVVLPAPEALLLERVPSRAVAPPGVPVDQAPGGEAALEGEGFQVPFFGEGADETVLELECFAGAMRGFA